MTEAEIVQLCKEGDREAQRELYAQSCDRIYRLLLRMTHNAEDAAELTQETYLRVFRSIHTFAGASSVTTWIYQIAVNEARQFLRRQKLSDEAATELRRPVRQGSEGGNADVRLDIEEALAKLPVAERTLIVLRHFEGLGYGEMAKVLGKPPGTVASGLNRARQMLREHLDPGFPRRS